MDERHQKRVCVIDCRERERDEKLRQLRICMIMTIAMVTADLSNLGEVTIDRRALKTVWGNTIPY